MPKFIKMLVIKENINKSLQKWLEEQSYSQIFVLVDENTEAYCLPLLSTDYFNSLIKIKSGEKNKTLATCEIIWNHLLVQHADRKSLLINLGGGVIGDTGGFCASSYKRGIDFINIPTTLLAQVDASVGGKTGIDFQQQKNMIGFFAEPKAVFISPAFLKTLASKQLLSGFAEVLKHGLIQDEKYFLECTQQFLAQKINWLNIIQQSVQIKANIVAKDPKEKGLRKILNFGHSIGHALETYSLKQHKKPLLHGEAVILGCVAELFLSVQKVNLAFDKMNTICNTLLQIYDFSSIEKFDLDEVIHYLLNDKKNQQKNIQMVLLPQIGEAVFDVNISKAEARESFHFLMQMIAK